jgi:proline iminopeptidase
MAELYPPIEPYDHGMLDVGDGNRVYWETCGNPAGKPALVLHGGPGSGAGPFWRRLFDPAAYRIVLFDQRGCGRSTPDAADPCTSLAANTTPHLIADIELLRQHLGVEEWLVLGGSWGVTLALAYAEQHSGGVRELVLFSVTNTTRREVEWVTRDMGRVFPEEWARFRDAVPERERDGSLVEAYARMLDDRDPAVRERAAQEWCRWEDVHVSTHRGHRPDPRFEDPHFRLRFARLVTHYWRHAGFLEDGALLRDAGKLAGIPGVMVHGRMDISGPPDVAWRLAQVWPDAELVLIGEEGHGLSGDATTEAVLAATDRFRPVWKSSRVPEPDPAG